MSLVLAVRHRGVVHMMADSGIFDDDSCIVSKDPKVFIRGQLLVGCVGGLRQIQVVREVWEPPKAPRSAEHLPRYMVTGVAETLRIALRASGASKAEHQQDSMEVKLLIGVRGRLFMANEDLAVVEVSGESEAIGRCQELARGALLASAGEIRQRLAATMSICAEHGRAVRKPFVYVKA